MTVQTIGTLFVLGALCLPLNLSRQTRVVPHALASPTPIPVTISPLVPEKYLIGKYTLSKFFDAEYLELKPGHRFSYQEHVCNWVSSSHQGTWKQQGGFIVLHPEDKASKLSNLRLIPVRWNNQLYLIDENQMPSFCHSRFSKDSSGDYGHYIKKLSSGSKTHLPIPERFRHFLEHGAINVRVASVDSERIATLEGADIARLQPGMHLCWKDGSGYGKCELRITEVGPDFARARQVPIHSKYDSLARPGEIFTTGGDRYTPVGTGMAEH